VVGRSALPLVRSVRADSEVLRPSPEQSCCSSVRVTYLCPAQGHWWERWVNLWQGHEAQPNYEPPLSWLSGEMLAQQERERRIAEGEPQVAYRWPVTQMSVATCGHWVGPADKFCTFCGQRVVHTDSSTTPNE